MCPFIKQARKNPSQRSGDFLVAPPRLELGEKSQRLFARRLSDESYAFIREIAGSRNVTTRFLVSHLGSKKKPEIRLRFILGGSSQT